MLEQYLNEVRQELAQTLPADDVYLRLSEIDAHLRDGIEGRIELGLSPTEAERETIVAFGEAKKVAASMVGLENVNNLRPRLRFLGLGYATFLFYMLVGWRLVMLDWRCFFVLFAIILLSAAGFAASAFRARRPTPKLFAAVAVGCSVFGTMVYGATWLNLYAFGGTGLIPPGEATDFLRTNQTTLAEHQEDRDRFEAGWAILRSPRGIEGLRRPGGYLAPVVQSVSYDERPQYTVIADAKDATFAWQDLSKRGRQLFDINQPQVNITSLNAALDDRWGNFTSVLPGAVQAGLFQTCAVVLADVAFGSLGAAVHAYRRRRRGRGGLVA